MCFYKEYYVMNKFWILLLLGTTFVGSAGFAMEPEDQGKSDRQKERARQGLPPLGQKSEPLDFSPGVILDKQEEIGPTREQLIAEQPKNLGVPRLQKEPISEAQKKGIMRDLEAYFKSEQEKNPVKESLYIAKFRGELQKTPDDVKFIYLYEQIQGRIPVWIKKTENYNVALRGLFLKPQLTGAWDSEGNRKYYPSKKFPPEEINQLDDPSIDHFPSDPLKENFYRKPEQWVATKVYVENTLWFYKEEGGREKDEMVRLMKKLLTKDIQTLAANFGGLRFGELSSEPLPVLTPEDFEIHKKCLTLALRKKQPAPEEIKEIYEKVQGHYTRLNRYMLSLIPDESFDNIQ